MCDNPDLYLRTINNDRLIVNENRLGVLASRNVGALASNGQYICFLDEDDELTENFVSVSAVSLEEGYYDIIDNGHYEVWFGKAITRRSRQTRICSRPILSFVESRKEIPYHQIWGKYIKRELWINIQNDIPHTTFIDDGFEDYIYTLLCLSKARNYINTGKTVYRYYRHNDSQSLSCQQSSIKRYLLGLGHLLDCVKDIEDRESISLLSSLFTNRLWVDMYKLYLRIVLYSEDSGDYSLLNQFVIRNGRYFDRIVRKSQFRTVDLFSSQNLERVSLQLELIHGRIGIDSQFTTFSYECLSDMRSYFKCMERKSFLLLLRLLAYHVKQLIGKVKLSRNGRLPQEHF